MSATRTDIARSVDATRAVLRALPPSKVEEVIVDIRAEMERFFLSEDWLCLKPTRRDMARARLGKILAEARAEIEAAEARVHRDCQTIRETLSFGEPP